MRDVLLTVCAVLLLVACVDDHQEPSDRHAAAAVGFGTYVEANKATSTANGAKQTRATDASVLTNINTSLRLQQSGFGVFGSYTGTTSYNSTTKPNFFWNQPVTYANGWTYTPTKYWPNGDGSVDDDGVDHVSYFAYAPYVAAAGTVTNGAKATGNTSLSAVMANDQARDPFVEYSVTGKPAESYDLLWGVAEETSAYTDVFGNEVKPAVGLPLRDLTKQRTTDVVRFRFKHALYRLAFKVSASIEDMPATQDANNATLVLIKELKLTGNFPAKGRLNLNNTVASKPLWESTTTASSNAVTIPASAMNAAVAYGGNWNAQVQSGGVNATPKQLLAPITVDGKAEEAFINMIPTGSSVPLTVSLTFVVVSHYDGKTSETEHTLTSTVNLSSPEAGKRYRINLIISSLTKMTFTIEGSTWQDPIYYEPTVTPWSEKDGGNIDFQ